MDKMNRRHFLAAGLGTTLVPFLAKSGVAAESTVAAAKPKLAISSYSYWHFREPKVSIDQVITKASPLGVNAVDVLQRQMDNETPAYLRQLKRNAFFHGVDLVALSIHQDFVDPSAQERQKNIEHTNRCIQIAHDLGIPCIRLNSGRWNTITSFNKLMEARGLEPRIEGYTDDDAFKWCIDSINV